MLGASRNTTTALNAAYWIKDQVHFLPVANTRAKSIIKGMVINGSDTFFVGTENTSEINAMVVLWKNGQRIPLTDGSQSALINTIEVVGEDVYVGGSLNRVATIWKNGTKINIGEPNSFSSVTYIKHYDSKINVVYVENFKSKIWRDGQSEYFGDTSIRVEGLQSYYDESTKTLYAVPENTNKINVYYKNGEKVNLEGGKLMSIYAKGDNVYVCGRTYTSKWSPIVWVNNTSKILGNHTQSETSFIIGGKYNQYFVAIYDFNNGIVKLWNGEEIIDVSDPTKKSEVGGIYVY